MRSYFSFRRASLNTDTWGAEGMPGPQWRWRLCRTRQLTNTIFLWLVVLFQITDGFLSDERSLQMSIRGHCRNLWFALQVNLGAWVMKKKLIPDHELSWWSDLCRWRIAFAWSRRRRTWLVVRLRLPVGGTWPGGSPASGSRFCSHRSLRCC